LSEDQDQEIDHIKYLSRIWNKERITKPNEISTLDKEFYQKYNQFMESPKYSERQKEDNQIAFQTFFKKRIEYIGRCAVSSQLTKKFESRLAIEESAIYNQINRIVTEFNNTIKKIK